MDKGKLTVLKADIDAQIREIETIYAKLDERRQEENRLTGIESIAYQLHNLYCAFEDLFKIIANTFENNIQDKASYHMELLKRMAISIEGIRPSLVSQESYALLDNLRSFRHLFRHAYSYELDIRKVRIVLDDAMKLREIYRKDTNIFLENLLC
ncbi:MAG: hypothetical protein A3K25_05745 [Planctomycetes bacterium RIFOXYB12_FULL_42_10]|nr:MAG: hypothetical protein A2069_00935 [Planctomycetes bacterium GWB2_41_19]OHC05243.1 MAG: hypothetical protein A3K25_05745 [Planctomycetes bacterium RIFOXYB12_FULL_42_10]